MIDSQNGLALPRRARFANRLIACAILLICASAEADTEQCLQGLSKSHSCRVLLVNYWQHEKTISNVAIQHGLEPALLKALVAIESRYNTKAVSPANARGLAQVLPSTASSIGLVNPDINLYEPEYGLTAGAVYLRKMWFEFKDWELALAAYNAGPGSVRKYKGIPPFKETQSYVPRVLNLYREFSSNQNESGRQ